MMKYFYIVVLSLILMAFLHDSAFAAATPLTQDDDAFDDILNQFFIITTAYQSSIVAIAEKVFFGLAIFHVAWVGFKMSWQGFEMQKLVAEYMKMLLFLGFFLALIRFPNFANLIIVSFIDAANNVTGANTSAVSNSLNGQGSITPTTIMGIAGSIARKAIANISIFKVGAAVLIGISVILIVVAFAIMVLRLIMGYVEAYIAISVGMIMLAFGAMSFTSELAKKYLFYLISVGVKLFVLLLILGIAQEMMRGLLVTWSFDNNNQIMLTLSTVIILAGLAMSIPSMISNLVTGSSSSGGGEIASLAGGAAGAGLTVAYSKFKAAKAASGGASSGGAGSIGKAMSVLNNKGGNGKK